MTWAVVSMHSEASAMIVERRDEVFILEGVGLLVVVLLLLRIWELGSGVVVSWNRCWAALEDRWLVGLCDAE